MVGMLYARRSFRSPDEKDTTIGCDKGLIPYIPLWYGYVAHCGVCSPVLLVAQELLLHAGQYVHRRARMYPLLGLLPWIPRRTNSLLHGCTFLIPGA